MSLTCTSNRVHPQRSELSAGENLCAYCSAQCCRYFALPIEKPDSWQDYDTVRWFMLHENVSLFVDKGVWYLQVYNKCKSLGEDNLCRQYESRPQICRDYTTASCEYDNRFEFELYFDFPEQIEEYAQAILGNRPYQDFRTDRN